MGGIHLIICAVLAQIAFALPESLIASYVVQLYHDEDFDIKLAIEIDYASGSYYSTYLASDTIKKDKIKEKK